MPASDDQATASATDTVGTDATLSRVDTSVLRRRLVVEGLAELDDGTEREDRRVQLLYEQVPNSQLATVLAGGLMVALMASQAAGVADLISELVWLAAAAVLSAARYLHARRALRESREAGFAQRERAVFVGALAAGTLWGLAPVAAPGDGGLTTWIPVLIMMAMMAGASVAFAASLRCFVAFCGPVFLGLLFFAAARGDGYALPLALLASVYALLMGLYVRNYHSTVVRSLSLRSENRHLLMNLNRNNARLQHLNASLEEKVEARTSELRDANKALRTDIDRRQDAERALRESEVRFRALYDDSPSMSFMLRPDGKVLSVNACGAQVLGLPAAAIVGRDWAGFVFAPYRTVAKRRLQGCIDAPGTATYGDLQVVRGDGSTLWLRVASRALRTASGGLEVLVTCQDVTDARLLSEQLGYFASHDTLTGLVNRRAFEERVRRVLRTAGEQNSDHAVCYLDLDHFKAVNDQGGHAAGDELLRRLAAIMREKVRRRDTIARLGGDEFGLLMEHCSIEQAMRIGTALRDAVCDYVFAWEEQQFRVGVSVGVAELNARTGSLDEALRRADAACYQAKEGGRKPRRAL